MNEKLMISAEIALRDCMNLQKEEDLLVLTDDKTQEIGQVLFEAGKKLSRESVLVIMPEREVNGQEPTKQIAELMGSYDAVICPTAKSLTHTMAKRNACSAGVRVATMPGITKDIMIRTLGADYHKIAERTYKVTEILDRGENVHVTSTLGTDILLPIDGIKAISSTGLVTEKGSGGNLPSGESYLMPAEGRSNGVFYVDGSFAGIGKIGSEPIKITVKDGYAVKIEGGTEAQKLEEMLKQKGHEAYNVAELGIGTNDQAIVSGMILEDEKVMGTAHIALGNNITMGGTCSVGIHLDGVILKPTVTVDGIPLMKDGKLLI